MGILQDVIACISKSTGKKKKRYSYSPAKNKWRWGILGLTVIGFLCGFTFIVGLLDPYSAYGCVVVHIFKPIYMLGNNLLESVFSKFNNYTFYQVDTSVLGISSLLIAIITLAVIFVMAWKHGRTWCNTVCPVGTVLGLLSRFSLFKVRIDTAKCNGCGLCATKCKASCINSKEHAIDYSRCVDCFDCLGACKQKALVYNASLKKQQANVEAPVPSCPNGAILPISVEQKHLTQMGYVVFIKENCIVYTDETSCGACSEHCPTQAVAMVPYKDGLTIPHVNKEICVGCGGCEYVCPARPFRAIYIEGNPVQKEAKPFKESEEHKMEIDDFGF